jgi:hypothetical protein
VLRGSHELFLEKKMGRILLGLLNGVMLNVIVTGGHKFALGPDGMTIQLKK